MAGVPYPTNLILPVLSGYSQMDSNKIRRNDVETGPPRFELLSEHGPAFFKAVWTFRRLDLQVFEGWYKHDLTFGAKSFDMDLLVGAGLKTHELYFDKPPVAIPRGRLFRVTANLIGVEKIYDDEETFDELLVLRQSIEGDLEAWVNQFNEIVEIDLPAAF